MDENYIVDFLNKELPNSERPSLQSDLRWNFVLDKHLVWERKPKLKKKKKLFLKRSERKELGLLKLPKTNWNYDDLQPMRKLWKQYMRKNLYLLAGSANQIDSNCGNISSTLGKSEFVGAEISVIRSLVPSTIGMNGTIVLETKSTFQIVTPKSEFKTLLKKPSVFSFALDNKVFTVFGKDVITKPSERSVKKIKSIIIPDL